MSDNRVLANAMIDISKRDERYIIDNQDIMDYTSALLNAFSQYHVDVDVSYFCGGHCDINQLKNINTVNIVNFIYSLSIPVILPKYTEKSVIYSINSFCLYIIFFIIFTIFLFNTKELYILYNSLIF